jgi:hypothetical protein
MSEKFFVVVLLGVVVWFILTVAIKSRKNRDK